MSGNPPRLERLEGNPWDRQRSESARSYERFCAYRDMQPRERTLARIANLFAVKDSAIKALSCRFRWVERAEKWDAYKEEQKRQAELEVIKDMGRRQAEQAKSFQSALVLPLRALTKKLTKDGQLSTVDFEELSISDLYDYVLSSARAFGGVVNVERIARGEATEIQEQNVSGSIRYMPPVIVRPKHPPTEATDSDDRDDRTEDSSESG